jgi:uncharacterized RmlC-like cupin family protein
MTAMKTVPVSPEEMEKRIARFDQLQPQSAMYQSETGIPREAYELMAAKTLYLLMAPETQGGPMAQKPAIAGQKGLSVIVARCPPGDKPLLHAHFKTHETFMCLTGRFRIRWGDQGEHETVIKPFDMIAVPPAVCRDFTNVSDEDALLLVLITGQGDEDFNDIAVGPEDSRMMVERFGMDVIRKYQKIGTEFMGVTV